MKSAREEGDNKTPTSNSLLQISSTSNSVQAAKAMTRQRKVGQEGSNMAMHGISSGVPIESNNTDLANILDSRNKNR